MIDQDSVDKVNNAVSGVPGLKVVDVDLQGQKLLLELDVTSSEGLEQIQKQIESTTGFVTVLKGFGDSFSAVAELHQSAIEFKRDHSKSILGVARLTQLNNNQCLVDAVIDHLPQDQSKIGINIHQFGDLSHPDLKGAGLVHIPINGWLRFRPCDQKINGFLFQMTFRYKAHKSTLNKLYPNVICRLA